jgi:hypothetical protein
MTYQPRFTAFAAGGIECFFGLALLLAAKISLRHGSLGDSGGQSGSGAGSRQKISRSRVPRGQQRERLVPRPGGRGWDGGSRRVRRGRQPSIKGLSRLFFVATRALGRGPSVAFRVQRAGERGSRTGVYIRRCIFRGPCGALFCGWQDHCARIKDGKGRKNGFL